MVEGNDRGQIDGISGKRGWEGGVGLGLEQRGGGDGFIQVRPHKVGKMTVKGGGCARIGEQVSCLEDGLHVENGSGGAIRQQGTDEPKGGGSLGSILLR